MPRSTPKAGAKKASEFNRRMLMDAEGGGYRLRIHERKGRSPRLLVKCGCCDRSVEIYADETTIEINGVIASTAEWRKLLGPLFKAQRCEG